MRFKEGLLISLVFLIALALAFPYDSLLRYRLARSFPALRYGSLSAAPWEASLTEINFQTAENRNFLIDEMRIRPAGIFPPAFKADIKRGSGQISANISGRPGHLRFDAVVSNAQLQEFLPDALAGIQMEVSAVAAGQINAGAGNITLSEIHVKSNSGGFEGTGEIRPAFPLKSATLYVKGQANLAGQLIPLDKAISLGDFLPAK